ncbi:hypothetical protein [Treponema pallidum]|uniref:Uncharacterized protein TP_0150 n=4 Tax=Treponema pallidum TaxID=160 RepID=Y150_TREPA|nr:hypothetical protein [Treponema pallidum]O83185.1 RecName: Full=Uncharacterized protein TP_0150; Flags: Precursor [Treponema pallidum subsp. pallidum str. Nichols]AAC65142.1 predicted coding region TP0150 [Treponema pallidum subsp. pallidum str. Nichols]ACD70576.1 hypothetical protein TPASS_0150 [Treponema pallidum subsp. pallidum SS14]ADD72300.1 conserved hypothetical protein [Treponema pallidum subsp. pallidum str. Chicago]AFU66180.1 hypothetical protein TPAMA_0150 [Treponema pallidum sub
MTYNTNTSLSSYAGLSAFALSVFCILWGTARTGSFLKEKALITCAADILARQAPELGVTSRTLRMVPSSPIPQAEVLRGKKNTGEEIFLYFFPLRGMYGSFPTLFLYDKKDGARFCHLIGNHPTPRDARFYGISSARIALQCRKIEHLHQTVAYE